MFRTLLIAVVVTALGAGAAVYTLSLSETDNGASEPTCSSKKQQTTPTDPTSLASTGAPSCCGSHGLQIIKATPTCCEGLVNSQTAKKSYRLFGLELTAAAAVPTSTATN